MRHPDHDRVEKLVLGRTLTKERDEALSDIPACYPAEDVERMRKIVGSAFDCGAVAAMKAILEDAGIPAQLLTAPVCLCIVGCTANGLCPIHGDAA